MFLQNFQAYYEYDFSAPISTARLTLLTNALFQDIPAEFSAQTPLNEPEPEPIPSVFNETIAVVVNKTTMSASIQA